MFRGARTSDPTNGKASLLFTFLFVIAQVEVSSKSHLLNWNLV